MCDSAEDIMRHFACLHFFYNYVTQHVCQIDLAVVKSAAPPTRYKGRLRRTRRRRVLRDVPWALLLLLSDDLDDVTSARNASLIPDTPKCPKWRSDFRR